MNPNMIYALKAIKNPEQFVKDFLKSNNNPILNNLVQEMEKGNTQSIEKFAENMFREKGINIDDVINSLK